MLEADGHQSKTLDGQDRWNTYADTELESLKRFTRARFLQLLVVVIVAICDTEQSTSHTYVLFLYILDCQSCVMEGVRRSNQRLSPSSTGGSAASSVELTFPPYPPESSVCVTDGRIMTAPPSPATHSTQAPSAHQSSPVQNNYRN